MAWVDEEMEVGPNSDCECCVTSLKRDGLDRNDDGRTRTVQSSSVASYICPVDARTLMRCVQDTIHQANSERIRHHLGAARCSAERL